MKMTLKLSMLVIACAAMQLVASEAIVSTVPESTAPVAAVQETAKEVVGRLASLRAAVVSATNSAKGSVVCALNGAKNYTFTVANKAYSKMPVRLQAAAEKTCSFVGNHKKAAIITASVVAALVVAGIVYKKLHSNEKKQQHAC